MVKHTWRKEQNAARRVKVGVDALMNQKFNF